MRNRLTTTTAALLLASANLVFAQQQPAPKPAVQPSSTVSVPWSGTIDFGLRPDNSTGNVAQYERYRDLGDGAFTRFDIKREGEAYLFNAGARNIGYDDQEYFADYNGGKVKAAFFFDGVPLNYGYNLFSPWQINGSTLNLDATLRSAIEKKQPGIVGIPQNTAQVAAGSNWASYANVFELTSKRQTTGFMTSINATPDLTVDLSFQSAQKTGYQPWGASFAFNVADELPMPLDNRTNDFSAGVEWANQKGMLRAAWGASWFNNNVESIVWDNPMRATDFNSGKPPYYDASGYTNGNGPAQGRMSLAPSNFMNVISATGMYKLPQRTTFTGTLAVTDWKQDAALIPWTINSVINSPQVLKDWPGLQGLERSTAEGEARGINAQFAVNSRPSNIFSYNVRYRYNDRENRTPMFDAVEYVRFDAVPEETGGETENYNITHSVFDATATLNLVKYTAFRVGYGRDQMDHTHRGFETLTDNTFRVSADTVGNQYVMLRGQYEYTTRRGSNFDEEWFADSGTQGATRLYDDAERNRNRGTVLFVVTPSAMVDFTVSMAAGRDKYNESDQEFGLLNNDNTSYNFGVNVTPIDKVAFGFNYGRDTYTASQESRNANPLSPTDNSWNDPTRNWGIDTDETVNNAQVYVTLAKALKNTDIGLTYDYMDSDNSFVHGGPRIDSLAAIGQFIPLPNVQNTWKRMTADVNYFFTKQVGVGIGYWYEKYDTNDWATLDQNGPVNAIGAATGTPRLDYLGELTLANGVRPYKGSTGFFRLLYVF
ncbi:MAG: MtrB/PioB family outer membrane beta-barrel protein [Acidobacteriota bacterium]